jgi:hypothetical protein
MESGQTALPYTFPDAIISPRSESGICGGARRSLLQPLRPAGGEAVAKTGECRDVFLVINDVPVGGNRRKIEGAL